PGRHDLPGKAELVFQPAALALFSAIGSESVPVVVDLFLILASHRERKRFVELEMGSTVEYPNRLPIELELAHHHASRGHWTTLAPTAAVEDLRIREERDIEIHGFFAVGIEPEKRCDLVHGIAPPSDSCRAAQPIFDGLTIIGPNLPLNAGG